MSSAETEAGIFTGNELPSVLVVPFLCSRQVFSNNSVSIVWSPCLKCTFLGSNPMAPTHRCGVCPGICILAGAPGNQVQGATDQCWDTVSRHWDLAVQRVRGSHTDRLPRPGHMSLSSAPHRCPLANTLHTSSAQPGFIGHLRQVRHRSRSCGHKVKARPRPKGAHSLWERHTHT